MEEINLQTIEWQAPEYVHKKKSADFLWTIGLIALVGAVAALWFGNYIFAIFIVISGACLIFFTVREPETVTYSISNAGVRIGAQLSAWNAIKGFHIKSAQPFNKLMIVTKKYFLPVYTIAVPDSIRDQVQQELLSVIPDIEIEESHSMLFMEKLGF